MRRRCSTVLAGAPPAPGRRHHWAHGPHRRWLRLRPLQVLVLMEVVDVGLLLQLLLLLQLVGLYLGQAGSELVTLGGNREAGGLCFGQLGSQRIDFQLRKTMSKGGGSASCQGRLSMDTNPLTMPAMCCPFS